MIAGIVFTALFCFAVNGLHLDSEFEITHKEPVLISENTEDIYDEQGKININTADKDELSELKGIGEKMSARIIKYREEKGDFNQKEDIMKVQGIGEGIFEEIKDDICVSD